MTIIVIVPAYNEAKSIAQTIASVKAQTVQPDRIVVAANNCNDGTEEVARSAGAEVLLAEPNKQKKAGALNLTLEAIVPTLKESDGILIMDADTTLSVDFIEIALTKLVPGVGGVGGSFIGRPTKSILGTLQQMEYYRYRSQVIRFGEKAFVLSGTGTLFSVAALRAVKKARDGNLLPKGDSFYDTVSLTEDSEITLALLTLGYTCTSPAAMTTTTDVMESVGALCTQRDRWFLGALWNIRSYGRKMPWYMRWIYWRQQAGLALTSIMLVMYAGLLIAGGSITFQPIWIIVTLVIIAERLKTIWRMGWKPRILAVLPVEQLYSVLLCAVFVKTVGKCLANNKGSWTPT